MMMLFTSVENCEIHNQTNEGGGETKKTRRRRRRIRADVEGSTESKKRKLSDEQVKLLEHNFGKEKKLEYGRKMQLASELGMDPKQVAVWFQNRRARWKNNQLEEEYMKLKSEHDVTVVQKCHLENEVLKLKEMLSEAEEKIKRFSGGEGVSGGGGGSSSSSSTTTTEVETNNSQANLSVENIGGFGDDGDIMYIDDQFSFNNYNIYMDYGYYFGM